MNIEETSGTLPELSASEIHRYLREMAQYGNRWLGTPAETKVRDYIFHKFVENGLEDVHLEELNYQNYMPKNRRLTVTSPVTESIRCEPLEYSANKVAEGELVYVGGGSAEEFDALEKAGVSLKEKIVMATSATPFGYVSMAEDKGAAGFVVATDPPGDLIRMLVAKLTPAFEEPGKHITNAPGVSVSLSGAQRLWSLMSIGKVKVRVEHEGIYTVKKSANVVGMVKGTRFPEEKIVLGAHYDSQIYGHAAWDNLTGVASIIEIGKIFAKNKPLRTVVLAAFTGEEIGLWGSSAYAKAHEADLRKNCLGMLCLDGISSIFPADRTVCAKGEFLDFIVKKAKEVGWEIQATRDPEALPWADYAPFLEIGVPAAWIWESLPLHPYYHTEKDLFEYIDPGKLVKAAGVHEAVAYDLAYKREIPLTGRKDYVNRSDHGKS